MTLLYCCLDQHQITSSYIFVTLSHQGIISIMNYCRPLYMRSPDFTQIAAEHMKQNYLLMPVRITNSLWCNLHCWQAHFLVIASDYACPHALTNILCEPDKGMNPIRNLTAVVIIIWNCCLWFNFFYLFLGQFEQHFAVEALIQKLCCVKVSTTQTLNQY